MDRPKLRKVERMRLSRDGTPLLVLRDPLRLSDPVAIDELFGPVLDLMDGQRTLAQIRQSLLLSGTLDVDAGDLQAFAEDLSEGGLLDDEHFLDLWQAEYERFDAKESRPSQLGGIAYPETARELSTLVAQCVPDPASRFDPDSKLLGVLCPHQPIDVAASVLSATLVDLPPADRIDGIVVLGTDHNAGLLPYVLTGKDYDTPLGSVPGWHQMVDLIEARVEWVRREEMRHRHADSIELAAVLLRHLYGDACPPVLPILCGLSSLRSGDDADQVDELLATLEVLLGRERVLFWGSAELSHAGPAYGFPPLDSNAASEVRDHDNECIDSLVRGRLDQMVRRCLDDRGQGRRSGTAAMNTLARLLPVGYRAKLAAYEAVNEPGGEPGQLGIAGVRFYAAD
jgi:hypothetical protein